MDFIEEIKALALKMPKYSEMINTEEGTKNALIMPFIKILGYDTSNPFEVVPEFTADIDTKNGKKVDYAIFKDDKPIDVNILRKSLLRKFGLSLLPRTITAILKRAKRQGQITLKDKQYYRKPGLSTSDFIDARERVLREYDIFFDGFRNLNLVNFLPCVKNNLLDNRAFVIS